MNSFMDIVKLVKDNCRSQMAETPYKLWIDPIEPVELKNNEVVLFTKSPFNQDVLIKNYLAFLEKNFKEVIGFDVSIKILCENDIPKEENQVQNSEQVKPDLSSASGMEKGEYEYTFETFIVGNSNSFTYAACKAVTEKLLGKQINSYNPLFIYGPSGLGKTHLITAIMNEVKKSDPSKNCIYVRGETFTNEIINAIQAGTTEQFRSKYRSADLLLVDDIQFISGKTSTQEEFFHTFNELHEVGKQIVLTSDRPPKDIKTLEERLRTRFEWGLLTDIQPPDFETRIAIIRRKAELLHIEIPNDVTEFIATKLKTNIRQLEGAVKKLKAYKMLAGSNPSIIVASTVIKEILNDNQPLPVTVERILSEVSKTFNVTAEDMRSNSRVANVSKARQIAMYVVKEITQIPYAKIGEEFGGRDHATIVYAIKQAAAIIEQDPSVKESVQDIINNIQNN